MARKIMALMLAMLLAAIPACLATEIPAYQVGDPVEDFSIELINGETFTLSEQKGKVVIVDLWATWCPNCISSSLPALEQLSTEYPDQIVVLAVDCGDKEQDVIDFVNENEYTIAVAADEELDIMYNYFPTSGIPYCVFIDEEGNFADAALGGGDDVLLKYQMIIDSLVAPVAQD